MIPPPFSDQAELLQAKYCCLSGHEVVVSQSHKVGDSEITSRIDDVIEVAPNAGSRHEKRQTKGLCETFVRRFAGVTFKVIDAGPIPVCEKVRVLVRHRHSLALWRMALVDENAIATLRRKRVHTRNPRWEPAEEHSYANFLFEDTS